MTGRQKTSESYRRELSCPLFDLRAEVVDVGDVDASDHDGRETITTGFLRHEVL